MVTLLRHEDVRHFRGMLRKADNAFVGDHRLGKGALEAVRGWMWGGGGGRQGGPARWPSWAWLRAGHRGGPQGGPPARWPGLDRLPGDLVVWLGSSHAAGLQQPGTPCSCRCSHPCPQVRDDVDAALEVMAARLLAEQAAQGQQQQPRQQAAAAGSKEKQAAGGEKKPAAKAARRRRLANVPEWSLL